MSVCLTQEHTEQSCCLIVLTHAHVAFCYEVMCGVLQRVAGGAVWLVYYTHATHCSTH